MIKTVSLETAKALKEAGLRQDDSSFYFVNWGKVQAWQCRHKEYIDKFWDEVVDKGYATIAAPTTDELLEELPKHMRLGITIGSKEYAVWDDSASQFTKGVYVGNNLAEAVAKMWLYLKKEGLIK